MKKIMCAVKSIFTRNTGILALGLVLSASCQGPLNDSQSPLVEGERGLSLSVSGAPDLPKPPVRPAGIDYYPGMKLVYLSWFPSARAESYEVYYSTGTDFEAAEQFEPDGEITEPKAKVTGLEDSTVYNFWVKAKNQGGETLSRMFKGSWPTSNPAPWQLFYRGSTPTIYAATNGGGDQYEFVDLGESYAPDERYRMTYGFLGVNGGAPIKYFGSAIIFQYGEGSSQAGKFDATYGSPNSTWPYKAGFGQANTYSQSAYLPGTSGQYGQSVDTLEEAIKKFSPLGGTGLGKKGGSYYFITPMNVSYQITGEQIPGYEIPE
jgi:hypothetical protein